MPDLPEAAVFIAASVDGYIARLDGALDWLPQAPQGEDFGYAAFMATVDALVMGRKTFEVVHGFGGEWPYAGTRVVVWSRGAPTVPEGVEVSSLAPASLLAHLGETGCRRVYVDGGETLQAFLRAGLVREMVITRIPLLLGQGIPLFGSLPANASLTHIETRILPGGLVQSQYRVQKAI